jgi:hypothetical protein
VRFGKGTSTLKGPQQKPAVPAPPVANDH